MTDHSRRDFIKASVLGGLAASGALALPLRGEAVRPSGDGRRTPRFGVNYVPRKNWMFNWLDWDRQSVAEDMQAIAEELNMDHVRVHCLWPYFQPAVNYVSQEKLDRLGQLLDAADAAGLDVEVTVLDGWMSGHAFMPAWVAPLAASKHEKPWNMFTAPEAIEGEKFFFRRLAETVGGHRRFLGFDLGNENSVLMTRPSLADSPTMQEADAWAAGLLDYCEKISPGKFHVNGADHRPWWSDSCYSRESLANTGHATCVHSYPFFTGALKMYGYSGVGSLHLVEYYVELAYAYQKDLSRPVWVEETGATADWMPASYMPEYADHLVRNTLSTGKVWGITWWASHDISPSIGGFAGLEYNLGLLDEHNKAKPLGRKMAELARSLGGTEPGEKRSIALVIPDRGLAPEANDWTYAKPYMNLIAQGKRPVIVLESRAHDEDYLRARGITQLIPLAKAAV